MGRFSRNKDKSAPVVDLREPDLTKPKWGSPVPCPECSGRGYLDHIDPFREVMLIHCTDCFAEYQVTRAEVEGGASSSAFRG